MRGHSADKMLQTSAATRAVAEQSSHARNTKPPSLLKPTPGYSPCSSLGTHQTWPIGTRHTHCGYSPYSPQDTYCPTLWYSKPPGYSPYPAPGYAGALGCVGFGMRSNSTEKSAMRLALNWARSAALQPGVKREGENRSIKVQANPGTHTHTHTHTHNYVPPRCSLESRGRERTGHWGV